MAGKAKASSKTSTDNVTTESNTKNSPARSKSPGRPKSPGRAKSPGRPKSPARTKSPVRTKSPARTKSPTRTKSPDKSKSPSRKKSPSTSIPTKQKSPSRSSPARSKSDTKARPPTPTRTSKLPARVKNVSPAPKASTPIHISIKSPSLRSTKEFSVEKEKVIPLKTQKIIVDTDTDSDNADSIPEIKEKPKAAVRGRTRRTDIENNKDEDLKKINDAESIGALGLMRRFTRSSQIKDVEKVVHLKHFDSITVTKRLGEFSDEDDIHEKKSQKELKEYNGNKKFVEFGGVYGALLLIPALPLTVLALYIYCTHSNCSLANVPNLGIFRSCSSYFDPKSYLGILAYFTLLALLTSIPAGGAKISGPPNKYGKFDYVLNGLISFVILLFLFAGLQFKKIDVATYLVKHIFQTLVGSILLSFLMSTLAYVRSFYVPVSALNTYAVGKNKVYGFFIGRELNPRLFSVVDLKQLFFRASLIATILIDLAFLSKSLGPQFKIENSDSTFTLTPKLLSIQPTILIFTILHAYYFLDSLIFESSWLTSFTHQQEGFGYLLTSSYCVAPFFNALLVKYVVENNVELATWKLVLAVLVYAVGLFVYRRSNNQKNSFRKNPYSPTLTSLETIPTSQGKKLLTSSFWGIVRHPNYLGDIILHLAWVPFVFRPLPALPIVLTILILVHRSLRDNAHCRQKYGAAWDRYCNRVRYALLPKVY